jgi:hypothetical protein
MDEESCSPSQEPAPGLSAGKAVLAGHALVTLPALVIVTGFTICGRLFIPKYWLLIFLVGLVFAWLWSSFFVPRWRRWALRRGAPPDRLYKLASATLLVDRKGSFLEKTEFKIKD